MGNPGTVRCPYCGGYGNVNLNEHMCSRCDKELFKNEIYGLCNNSNLVLQTALKEVKVKFVDDLPYEKRSVLRNLIKRRQVRPRAHITKPKSAFEKTIGEPDGYGIEKRGYTVENME